MLPTVHQRPTSFTMRSGGSRRMRTTGRRVARPSTEENLDLAQVLPSVFLASKQSGVTGVKSTLRGGGGNRITGIM
jgi:hypothetical protein